jgi:hypothetical protein
MNSKLAFQLADKITEKSSVLVVPCYFNITTSLGHGSIGETTSKTYFHGESNDGKYQMVIEYYDRNHYKYFLGYYKKIGGIRKMMFPDDLITVSNLTDFLNQKFK